MVLPPEWVGEFGDHLLERSLVPAELVTNLGALVGRLEAAHALRSQYRSRSLDRLAGKRREFRDLGRLPDRHAAFTQLWRIRSELVVADKLLDSGVDLTIRADTPDFECQHNGRTFGLEVTTRLPAPIEDFLRDRLARDLPAGAAHSVRLHRSHPPRFALSDMVRKAAVDRIAEAVQAAVEATSRPERTLSLSLPEAGLVAEIGTVPAVVGVQTADDGHPEPLIAHGVRVTDRGTTPDLAYWRAAARQVASSVTEKAGKSYKVADSVLAIDVTRLGWCGRWPIAREWTAVFDETLDACAWGPLKGVVLFRSWLWDTDPTSNTVQVVTSRGTDDLPQLVVALLSTTANIQ